MEMTSENRGTEAGHGTTVVLFGPQVLSFNKQSFDKLRASLLGETSLHWIQETVTELPHLWEAITQSFPKLSALSGETLLSDLDKWLKNGVDNDQGDTRLPNIILTPLVVITQLTQYWQYLELNSKGVVGARDLHPFSAQRDIETLGFCTGLLSAFAVSCSFNEHDLRKYGAVAIRLAMLIGAFVDVQDVSDDAHGRAESYAMAWNNDEQDAEMMRLIERFPEAYISVQYDERRATLTTSERTAPMLLEQLKEAGITAAKVGLQGRFHCSRYENDIESLVKFCNSNPGFQFPDAANLALPTRTNNGGEVIKDGKMHELALHAILIEQSKWYQTFAALQTSKLDGEESLVVSFGSDRFVPPTLMRRLGSRLIHFADLDEDTPQMTAGVLDPEAHFRSTQEVGDSDIAIIGMSIKVAGADDTNEFWEILSKGQSQHQEVPESRMGFETHWRDLDTERKWYGNFLNDVDGFDHKFFKKSPREAASTDPQQRLMLQAAYQAVEQSGYFNLPKADTHVGCYIGACAADYEHNIACHPPNAFSATGNLRGFLAGKVSHYFGWTGPGITIDTACSSSAVAIHMGCKAILTGECNAALAGGVATISNPLWFQNLAGATFLSPTGQCKPFDELADGYCRGEGIACVFLKKMSTAIADGNQIFGCIPSTAVYQNQNCTPLFVPNSPSLSLLFGDVVRQARLEPQEISLVEAHGTGTPVGDPAEYESIRLAVAGPNVRKKPLPIGSVKGFIGHTEGASGVISLIKVLIMMQEGYIPPQASFSKMSHHINTSASDMMEVVTSLRPWTEQYKAALINNYGASGSNASMIITQPPQSSQKSTAIHTAGTKYPFWISALDDRSITEYCAKLIKYIKSEKASVKGATLADLSFNVCRQSNRAFSRGLVFTCTSISELQEKLTGAPIAIKSIRPVILCFGGQVSTFVGLDRSVYENIHILQRHLDECDVLIQSLGLESIYPAIFQRTPIQDTVKLQAMLFSMQYSCAKSWMDCGVKVEAVVGHSFGEITALCISGVLSLQDTIKLVVGRAKVVRDMWGADRGAMMAVEGDVNTITQLLAEANKRYDGEHQANIACHNGPRSFTLAGSTEVINIVEEISQASFPSLKRKKLNVTNAFHSSLVKPLLDSLEQVGRDLTFKKPYIRLERATESRADSYEFTPRFVADHMKNPVFFNHAIQRLAKEFPSSIWLEAGSSSTITVMASRALGSSDAQYFQAMNLTNDRGIEGLTDATALLWKEGLRASFWAHHPLQTREYAPLLLPPYQFESSHHWLELKKPLKSVTSLESKTQEAPLGLFTFVGYKDATNRSARFRVNTMTKDYEKFVSGHKIAQTAPICPATLEIDMAIEALFTLRTDYADSGLQPSVLNMANHSPICVDPSRLVWLDYELVDPDRKSWTWKIVSTSTANKTETKHVHGQIQFRDPVENEYQAEFARLERLVTHRQCTTILEDDDADDIIQGRNVYESFAPVVDYGELYRGVRKVVGRGNETAGRVCKGYTGETWLDAILSDCFSQVSGLWVNCMTDIDRADMYIASGCEIIMRSPKVRSDYKRPSVWDVFARHHRETEKTYLTDVFVFDSTNGQLVEVMLGIQYAKIAKASMSKILTRLTAADAVKAVPSAAAKIDNEKSERGITAPAVTVAPHHTTTKPVSNEEKGTKTHRPDISDDVRNLIANVSGLEASDIKNDSELADFGIDSLMGMELAREVETVFGCTLDQDQLVEATSFRKFVKCICSALYGADDGNAGNNDDSTSVSDFNDDSNTPEDTSDEITTASSSPPTERVTVTDSGLKLSQHDILASFGESKMLTDKFIRDYKIDNFSSVIFAESNRLCVALIVEAFEQLGCSLKTATKGQVLERINYEPRHGRLVEYLYDFLEAEARLIDVRDSQIIRTSIPVPKKSSEALLEGLLRDYPEWTIAHQLTHYAGKNLKDVLLGKTDGIRLIFGSAEGRRLVSGLYCDHSINKMGYEQMKDFIGRLISRLPSNEGPLKILEMGAGTGGTTQVLAPYLATLDVPVEYTFTDLSASMVAQARLKYGKIYPFMKFAVHDIEKPPAPELRDQHIVIASNAIHATHSLTVSGGHIHSALRSDGFLLMLEMTQIIPHIELIFGLLEGWWLFDDGRRHAISDPSRWERSLKSVGFGHVDYSDGSLPETDVQKVIIALASGPAMERLPKPEKIPVEKSSVETRESDAEKYVTKYSEGFTEPLSPNRPGVSQARSGLVIFITGTTGSLGSHLVEQFSLRPDVDKIVCLNRRSNKPVEERQQEAFSSRGICLPREAKAKLWVLDTNAAKPNLGLPESEYTWLIDNVSHIIHNAWPMSGTRPIEAFEPHFHVLRILIDLAHSIASRRSGSNFRVSFQFVSSIGVVGHYPLWSGKTRVPEERVQMKSVLDNGYCEAKFTCERILDETLHKYPEYFRPISVRLGQIAGSRTSGYWNPVEHLSFLIKSSQSLKALPAFEGVLQWVPVNDVAKTLVDLSISDSASYPIYHIDNPVGQPWPEMIEVLADALEVPRRNIVPFREWVKIVRRSPLSAETDNPAAKLINFLDDNFLRMSCGGLILDTTKAREHSKTLAVQGPVTTEIARRYIQSWKNIGILQS
ncbi:hypothetical protein F4805DRAFT_460210 [Annulohypoxylon moriforme]|nr:hypothetical protein F4805DRAFT_460210 [Annulohypoxylon moriforme]